VFDIGIAEREGTHHMDTFTTRNPDMESLLEQARRLSGSDHPVLLQGEGGTGKERLARYMHAHSSRWVGPFVKVDCVTLPGNLWESELATRVAQAFGGTLFLDEVSEVPLPAQALLLRLLQDNLCYPAGALEPVQANVRVVAATARNLSALLEQGFFRPDLYHRLNVLPLALPPLRERKEDLELLTGELLAQLTQPGASAPALTAEAIAALLLYDWPGNIRELENALKLALLLAGPQTPIALQHLPPEVAGRLQPAPPPQLFKRYVRSAELLLIRWALSTCGGDRTRTAKFLGLSRAAFYKKLRLYPEFRTEPAAGGGPAAS